MGTGKVVQVIGTVVDVEFGPEELPELYGALELDNSGQRLLLEVQQHIGNNWVRCLALGATDGLARGVSVNDTGQRVTVPVGPRYPGKVVRRVRHAAGQLGPRGGRRELAHTSRPPRF